MEIIVLEDLMFRKDQFHSATLRRVHLQDADGKPTGEHKVMIYIWLIEPWKGLMQRVTSLDTDIDTILAYKGLLEQLYHHREIPRNWTRRLNRELPVAEDGDSVGEGKKSVG